MTGKVFLENKDRLRVTFPHLYLLISTDRVAVVIFAIHFALGSLRLVFQVQSECGENECSQIRSMPC